MQVALKDNKTALHAAHSQTQPLEVTTVSGRSGRGVRPFNDACQTPPHVWSSMLVILARWENMLVGQVP